jgi:hypothetical protein
MASSTSIKSKFPTSSRQVHPQAALLQKADVARAGDRSRPPDRAGILAETRRSKARRALIAGLVYPNPSARKIEFDKRFKARISVQSFCEKYLSSVFRNYVVLSRPSRLDAEGVSRSSRHVRRGCDGREGDARRALSTRTAKSCGPYVQHFIISRKSYKNQILTLKRKRPADQGGPLFGR